LPKVEKFNQINQIVEYNVQEENISSQEFKELSEKTKEESLKWILERISKRNTLQRFKSLFRKKRPYRKRVF